MFAVMPLVSVGSELGTVATGLATGGYSRDVQRMSSLTWCRICESCTAASYLLAGFLTSLRD